MLPFIDHEEDLSEPSFFMNFAYVSPLFDDEDVCCWEWWWEVELLLDLESGKMNFFQNYQDIRIFYLINDWLLKKLDLSMQHF